MIKPAGIKAGGGYYAAWKEFFEVK